MRVLQLSDSGRQEFVDSAVQHVGRPEVRCGQAWQCRLPGEHQRGVHAGGDAHGDVRAEPVAHHQAVARGQTRSAASRFPASACPVCRRSPGISRRCRPRWRRRSRRRPARRGRPGRGRRRPGWSSPGSPGGRPPARRTRSAVCGTRTSGRSWRRRRRLPAASSVSVSPAAVSAEFSGCSPMTKILLSAACSSSQGVMVMTVFRISSGAVGMPSPVSLSRYICGSRVGLFGQEDHFRIRVAAACRMISRAPGSRSLPR